MARAEATLGTARLRGGCGAVTVATGLVRGREYADLQGLGAGDGWGWRRRKIMP